MGRTGHKALILLVPMERIELSRGRPTGFEYKGIEFWPVLKALDIKE